MTNIFTRWFYAWWPQKVSSGTGDAMKIRVQIFKSKDGWRVRLRASNGEIVMSGEAYVSKSSCLRSARKVAAALGVKVKSS